MHIRTYLATLEFVNTERAQLGLSPLDHLPEGRPRNPNDCVIARAVPGEFVDGMRVRTLSAEVRRFVAAFDRGSARQGLIRDPALLVEGGIDDDKGCLVPA